MIYHIDTYCIIHIPLEYEIMLFHCIYQKVSDVYVLRLARIVTRKADMNSDVTNRMNDVIIRITIQQIILRNRRRISIFMFSYHIKSYTKHLNVMQLAVYSFTIFSAL